MPNVPSLNTDNISFVSYYNLSSSDDIKSNENFNAEELYFGPERYDRYRTITTKPASIYDNGIQFKVEDTLINKEITIRAGNDKWITAHMSDYSDKNGGEFTHNGTNITDVSNFNYQIDNKSNLNGEYDIMPWTDKDKAYDFSKNTLFSAIEKSLLTTSFWKRSSLKYDKAGIYNYTVPNNQEISVFSSHEYEPYEVKTYGLSFTDNTVIHKAYLVGTIQTYYQPTRLDINGSQAMDMPDRDGYTNYYFTLNIKELLKNNKQLSVSVYHDLNPFYSSIYCIIIWS